jgi:hypothetical protein
MTVLVTSLMFLAFAARFHDATVLPVALAIIAKVPAVWMTTVIFGEVILLSQSRTAKRKDPALITRRWIGARPSVWDEWLDGPGRA